MGTLWIFINKIHSNTGYVLYLNMVGMIFISLLEGIGIVMLLPMINYSGIIDLGLTNYPNLPGMHLLHNIPLSVGLPLILGMYVFVIVCHTLLQRNFTIRNTTILHGFTRHLRVETYSKLLQTGWSFFAKKRKSDLINILTVELSRSILGISLFLQLISAIVFTFVQISIALFLSVKMTILVLLCGVVLTVLSKRYIVKAKKLGNRTTELGQSYLAGITDHFNGIKDVKSNMLEASRLHWFRSITREMLNEQIEYIKLKTGSELVYKIGSSILIAAFIYLFVNLFQSQPAELLLIVLIFSRLWPRFTGIQSSMQQIASAIPALNLLHNLHVECENSKELIEQEQSEEAGPLKLKYGIECRSVYFRYNQNEPAYALQNINLNIPVNQMTAVVGRSGAGKSTLVDIIMGMMRPESGQVLVDGDPLTSCNLLSFRKCISYVPQDPFLFNGSIRDNLLLMDPYASEIDMFRALEFAACDFVERLPQGLDTMIGDRGIRLSGGERQRLVLARAILRKPEILVLDEATSALDSENELKIQEALERLKGMMTIIVIAHRLSTIRNADQVIVLDQGEVVQTGEFIQLAKEKKGLFSQLLGNQMKVASMDR